MQRFLFPRAAVRLRTRHLPSSIKRHAHTDYELKYAEKLLQKAKVYVHCWAFLCHANVAGITGRVLMCRT